MEERMQEVKSTFGENIAQAVKTALQYTNGSIFNQDDTEDKWREKVKQISQWVDPLFDCCAQVINRASENRANLFVKTIESYLDSVAKKYENPVAKWYGLYSLETHCILKIAESSKEKDITSCLQAFRKAEEELYQKKGQEDWEYINLLDNLSQLTSQGGDKLQDACEHLSENEKLFLLMTVNLHRDSGLRHGFVRGSSDRYVYEYHIGSTCTFMASATIMKNLEYIGITIDKYTQRGTSLRKKDLIPDLLSYLGLGDLRALEEEELQRKEEKEKDKAFQKELSDKGFFQLISLAEIKMGEFQFLVNFFQNQGSIPTFNRPSIERYLGSIKKENGVIVYAQQDFSTQISGNNVVDNVATQVVIGTDNAILFSGIVDIRGFRTTNQGVFGYHPCPLKIKKVVLLTDKAKVTLTEMKDDEVKREFEVEVELGEIFQRNPVFEKKIRKEINSFFKKWEREYHERIVIPCYVDQKILGSAGITVVPSVQSNSGYRPGRARVTGIKFIKENMARFEIFAEHEYNSGNQRVEWRHYKFMAILEDNDLVLIEEKRFKTEKRYLDN